MSSKKFDNDIIFTFSSYEKVFVLCEKSISQFSSNLHVCLSVFCKHDNFQSNQSKNPPAKLCDTKNC